IVRHYTRVSFTHHHISPHCLPPCSLRPRASIAVAPRRIHNVPLFWKLLVPFLVLVVVIGLLGSFLTVRNLSTQAAASLDHDLLSKSLEVRALVHDRELYLLESANFAANLQGVGEAMRRRDATGIPHLLPS